MEKKKSPTSSIHSPLTLWIPTFPAQKQQAALSENSTADEEAGKGRWPSSHTLRLNESPRQQDSGEEGRVALFLHMVFIPSMSVPLGQRWQLDRQQDGVVKSVPKGQML